MPSESLRLLQAVVTVPAPSGAPVIRLGDPHQHAGPVRGDFNGIAAHTAAQTGLPFSQQVALARQAAAQNDGSPDVAEQLLRVEIIRQALADARIGRVGPHLGDAFPETKPFAFEGWSATTSTPGRLVLAGPGERSAVIDRATWSVRSFTEDGPSVVQSHPEAVTVVPDPEPRFEGPEVMDRLFPIVAVVFICLTLMTLGLPLVKAWVRRLERSGAAPRAAPDDAHRFDRLEQAMEAVAIEVERIGEAQRYQTKLFAERAPAFAPLVERTTVDGPPRPNRTPPEGVAH